METREATDDVDCSASAAGAAEGGGGGEEVSPEVLAEQARASMRLPEPVMAGSPRLGAEQLVHVPVWLWVERAAWKPVSARAEVTGGSVSVRATPQTARWSLGDGRTVACKGPGTRYVPGRHDPASESPTCGATFTRSSAGEPGGSFDVGVAITWDVEWETSEGRGGALEPLVTSAETGVVVSESAGVVTRS
ncbi:hypothetical protein CLV63_11253 [Murinocardiopsis flavida]|uniref:ATP/GTP-binding protein n=1 Tax=Murinocardiopsis flavida TaxID=645275 RepID=A0A2P8DG29_9ACTN|nr:hypothetical protein [Murinocardiopsis flavida]PSK96171.1 hypothetical protein CLV63_11253 [Murinocardiopsis flavida]